MAAGGSGDGDFGNQVNFWQDSSWTIPNGATSTSTDDVQLDDTVLTISGSGSSVNNLTTSTGTLNFSRGPGLVVYGTVTGVTINSAYQMQGVGAILNCVSVTFNGDPFYTAASNTINGISGCIYNTSFGEILIDNGGNFTNAGITFVGTVSITNASNIAASFSGSLTLNNCTTNGSSFSSSGTMIATNNCTIQCTTISNLTATDSYIELGTYGTLVLSGHVNIGSATNTILNGPTSFANVTDIIGSFANVSIPNGNMTLSMSWPATAGQVQVGHSRGICGQTAVVGTPSMTLPTTAQVQMGAAFGPNASLTGTFVPGNGSVGYFG